MTSAITTVLPRQDAGPALPRGTTSEGQLTCSHDPKASSTDCWRRGGYRKGWVNITAALKTPHSEAVGPALPCSRPRGCLTCTPITRVSTTVLSRGGAGQLSHVLQLVRGRASSPKLMTPCAAFLTARDSEGVRHLCACATPWQMSGGVSSPHSLPQGLVHPHTPTTRASSTVLPEQGTGLLSPALPLVSRAQQPVRSGASSAQPLDIHMILSQGRLHVLHHEDSDRALSGSSGWDWPLTTDFPFPPLSLQFHLSS